MNPPDTTAASPSKAHVPPSPRSSVDSQVPGATPFLQNLQQRFRKSSNDSSISSESPDPPRSRSEANRAAKRFLLSVVRDDWEYPLLEVKDQGHIPSREPVAYRHREDGLSDLESDSSPNKRRSWSDPYKFESPDSVANVMNERKRKRRRLFEEEQKWNTGLRNWAQQRDAWTGAVQQQPKPVPSKTKTKSEWLSSSLHGRNTSESTDGSHSNSNDHNNNNWTPSSPTGELSPATTSSSVNSELIDNLDSGTISQPDTHLGPWLPVFPPLLPPEHASRARMTPSSYPTIYSKVVTQLLTPNVPIPLTVMVPALVAGWKSEGAWPPQPSAQAAADAKTGKGSSAFSRWRREQNMGGPKSRVRRSIGAMRRAFGVPTEEDLVEDLGIEFREQDTEEMEGNITLNKGLLEEKS